MIKGHVEARGLEMYHERHGQGHGHGPPVLLLHGAFGTIESCFAGLLPRLAERHEVIAAELQGHGRTPDVERPLSYEGMAADTAAFLDALGLERAHVVGYSMGGAVGLRLAVDRPDLVDRLVYFGGVSFDPSGVHPGLAEMFETFDPHQLDGTHWQTAYRRVAPDPDGWLRLVEKVNELDRAGFTIPRERLTQLRTPTMLMIGDADIVTPEHVVELFRLLGGGVPGDLVPLPHARLAVLPGTNHVDILDRVDWVASMITAFLA